MNAPIRLVNVNDHEVVRRGIDQILATRPEWQIVGDAADGDAAIEIIERLQPDVVITDFAHPGPDGLEIVRRCKTALPRTHCLLATMHVSKQLFSELLYAGGSGCMLLTDAKRDLIPAIEAIVAGKVWLNGPVRETLIGDGCCSIPLVPDRKLTLREIQIVKLLISGKNNKEVANQLKMSLRTAETHRANIMYKLQLHSIQELADYAVREKLIEA